MALLLQAGQCTLLTHEHACSLAAGPVKWLVALLLQRPLLLQPCNSRRWRLAVAICAQRGGVREWFGRALSRWFGCYIRGLGPIIPAITINHETAC